MICPFCQSPKLRTTKTVQKKASVVRYHRCARCGRQMRSIAYLDIRVDPRNRKSISIAVRTRESPERKSSLSTF